MGLISLNYSVSVYRTQKKHRKWEWFLVTYLFNSNVDDQGRVLHPLHGLRYDILGYSYLCKTVRRRRTLQSVHQNQFDGVDVSTSFYQEDGRGFDTHVKR